MNIYNKNWAQYEYSYNLANSRENWAQTKKLASGRLIFCAQTDARRRTQMHARGQTQTHAKFFGCILCPSCCMFRSWVSLPANPCPMLVAFQDPEIQLALERCFRNPAHTPTALRTSVSLGDLAWFLDMLYWEVLAVRLSLSRVDSLHLT